MSLFTYLHIHTHFSLGGGPASPEKWCRQASELGYEAIGIADRAPMPGFPRFDAAARSNALTPMFGVELDLLLPSSKSTPLLQPALLFACDHNGVSSLARICSIAYEGWPSVEVAVPWEKLSAHAQGLVIILLGGDEAGAFSPVVSLAPKKRSELGSILHASFGGKAFIGVPHSGRPGDGALAGQVVRAAGELGLPAVALPTARYLEAEDAPSYEALRLARQRAGWPRESISTSPTTGSTTPDRPGPHFLRTPAEAAALFAQWPETLDNLARIVELCSGANHLPLGTEHQHGKEVVSLPQLAGRKLLDIMGTDDLPPATKARLEAEVAASEQSGRVGSWLALTSLKDIAARGWQDQAPIPLGATLGLADGSLLAYALGLSSLDPMLYPPPRWLANTSQVAPLPGIEVPASKRAALISALVKENGPNRAAYAACANDITPAAALSAAALVLGVEKDAVRQLPGYKGWSALKEYIPEPQEPKLGSLAALASSLEGAPVTFKPDYDTLLVVPRSVYGAAVIEDWLPVVSSPGADWVPWSEEALCKLSYPALSIQPSTALSALEAGFSLATRFSTAGFTAGVDLTLVPEVTEQTAQVFIEGRLVGIPYVSSEALATLQSAITPESLALMVARSLVCGLPPAKEGIAAWEEATSDTGGLLIYKDQLDLLLSSLAGPEQDTIFDMRAAIREGSDDARARFTSTCQASGLEADSADALWSVLSKSGVALISRSSAHAWGRVMLWSAMLKAHHPVALLAGALDAAWDRGTRDQIQPLVEEAQRLGISVRPPDIDQGVAQFSLERDGTGWAITWGLGRLPGWDVSSAERLVRMRPAAGFTSFSELGRLASRAGLTQTHKETLIRAGGCDRLGGTTRSRPALLEALNATIGVNLPLDNANGPTDLFNNGSVPAPPAEEVTSGGQPTPRERYLQRIWEMKNLGIGFTQAPEMDDLHRALENSGDLKGRLLSTTQVGTDRVGQSVSLVGLLASLTFIKGEPTQSENSSNNGNSPDTTRPTTMSVAWLEDMEGSIELVAFPPNYNRHREQWAENSLVIVTARVITHESGDIYLLCEHLAPFYADTVEAGFSIKVKVPARGALRKGSAKSNEPGPTSDGDVVAASVAPQTTPLRPPTGSQPIPEPFQSAATAKESSNPTYSLVITLPEADNDNAAIDAMNALKRLLAQYPGSDVVTLRIPYSPETGSVTSAQLPYGVQYNRHLESEVTRLFGPASLAVIQLASHH